MSQAGPRRGYPSLAGSTLNQKAALASAYQELGKELSSTKLKMVGNYTLQRPIGEGTYGKVRLGLHRLTNTRVAIKQIPKAHSASLTREIHHHRRLHHPNVMQLYEVIATEQYIWMVSELCAGGELYDYLVEHEVLPEAEARRIFGQLCLAVAYIHSKGIVHRDLKLENILLDEKCNVKLGDFGFTREFEGKRLMETFCGTTGYASPEMLACKKYSGEEVDVWSLGVILYALLCGALPFDDDDESVMKAKILQGEFEIPDCLSEEAQDLIRSILQQDPTNRPSIKAILSHPWFTKVMAQTSMSTVEEDTLVADDFDTKPADSVHTEAVMASSQPHLSSDHTQVLSGRRSTELDFSPSSDTRILAPEKLPKQGDLQALADDVNLTHQASVSAVSESSYHSARSDSESSDRRSSSTDTTDPTTADSASRPDDLSAFATKSNDFEANVPEGISTTAPIKDRIGMHRNESQTTIKRTGSNGSDASFGANGPRPPTRSTSMSLPTHHELPGTTEGSNDDFSLSLYQSVPLAKRGSQSSSRGHHRTPSRTKRRSLSSGGLSDHQPPLLGRKPVDYSSQLNALQPASFSTAVEQQLLHQLSSLGMDVGQMVHSVVHDACDASGAMWWMLLRKAQDRHANQAPSFTLPTTANPVKVSTPDELFDPSNIAHVPDAPPPLPQKDPSRLSEDRTRASLTASRSESSGLADGITRRLHTVVSHEELDLTSDSMPSASSFADLRTWNASRNAPTNLSSTLASSSPIASAFQERSLTGITDSTSPRPESQHRHTTAAAASPSKLIQVASGSPHVPSSPDSVKGRRSSQAGRPRSNSLSVKQFAQTVLGTKDKAAPAEQVIVAGEALPYERAKSPNIFGRRNTVGAKDSLVGRLSSPSTPKKSSMDVTLLDMARKSTSKKSVDADLDGVKVLEQGGYSPSRSATASTPNVASAATALNELKDSAAPSQSQDSFSTMSMTPQGSEKSGSKNKSGSSFIATVRTWLGAANEKPSRKGKSSKKSTTGHGVGPVDDASKSTAGNTGSGTISRSPSVRRRSAHYQQTSASRRGTPRSPHMTSASRRSSTGSSNHFAVEVPPNSLQTRPSNFRRMSAGSITPTGTMYGDYMQDHVLSSTSRPSRPSSTHSHSHSISAVRPGLHGKTGSSGSTNSAFKPGIAGSTYSSGSGRRHARRPSHDGSTMVRRHRTYASSTGSPSRRNSRNESRPSSIKSRASSPGRGMSGFTELDVEGNHDAGENGHLPQRNRSGKSTPRRSLDAGPVPEGRKNVGSAAELPDQALPTALDGHLQHAQNHNVIAQSIFVAHKARSPYKPPSANPHLHGAAPRAHQQHGSTSSASTESAPNSSSAGLPEVGTGTWRHSWGRPPPCWAGPVDPPPQGSVDAGRSASHLSQAGRTKLRDVFANRDDDDWTDEEEEPSYSGGLGQLDSHSSHPAAKKATTSSPFATRNFAAIGSGSGSTTSADSGYAGAAPFSSRYAGVRGIFQPPTGTYPVRRSHEPLSLSLGNEFAPKVLSSTLHSPTKPSAPAGQTLANLDEMSASASSIMKTTQQPSQPSSQQGSRITSSFHKPDQIVEEDEEED